MIDEIIKRTGTPIYIYEEDKIIKNYEQLKEAIHYKNKEIHYALMCNNNPEILKIMKKLGLGVQINSLHELGIVKKTGFEKSKISFTSSGLSKETVQILGDENVMTNLDSVEEVKKYSKTNQGNEFGIRLRMPMQIDLPEKHTNSPKESYIGIEEKGFKVIKKIARTNNCTITGIHGYLASNLLDTRPFLEASEYIAECAKQFSDLKYINFGSGFGLPEFNENKELDITLIGKHYSKLTERLSRYFNRSIQLKIEPGRYLVGNAGTLYAKVTNIKKLDRKKQISVDVGFGGFARPKLYGAEHEIIVVSKSNPEELYDIRANTTLQDDFLAKDRYLPKTQEGDIIAIKNTGAYGMSMASGFPGKQLPKEAIVLTNDHMKIV